MRKRRYRGAARLQGRRFVNMPLTLEDKYIALKSENEKLKRSLRKLGDAFSYWRERALELEGERDLYREDLQELSLQARRGNQ